MLHPQQRKVFNKLTHQTTEYLCDDCKKLGVCRLRLSKPELEYLQNKIAGEEAKEQQRQATINREKNKRAFTMDNLAIANLTPLHVQNNPNNRPYKKQLQTAYEAFHQKDYETAILNYRAVLSQDPMNVSAFEGISVALYFINNIKGALNAILDAADNSPDGQYLPFLKFTVHLRNRLKDEEEFFSFSLDEIPEEENATPAVEKSNTKNIKATQLVILE
jgi:tetratricopeptide (TPR) repeat protein